jgi:hypothetical protein
MALAAASGGQINQRSETDCIIKMNPDVEEVTGF